MIRHKSLFVCVLALLVFGLSWPAQAEEKKDEFYGSFMIGYRGVDVDGAETKYKEDYNLYDGARLFHFGLKFKPAADSKFKKFFDELKAKVYNFGGDPYESFDLSVAKYGTYKFKFNRRKTNYFYQDAFVGHDFHHYDFDRIQDTASLRIWLTRSTRLYFNFDRYTKMGHSTTSLDISRDEFEFEKPVDESSKEISIGVDLSVKGFYLMLEEKIQDYANDYHYFLPGYSLGEDPGDMTVLSLFNLNQPYDFRSFTHSARFTARPGSNFLMKGSARFSDQDLRLSYSEYQMGTSYLGTDFDYGWSGDGNYDRKMQMYDLDFTYLISNRVAFLGGVRYQNLDQEGVFNVYGAEMEHALDYNTLGLEVGLQYQASAKTGVTLGVRHDKREVNMMEHGMAEQTVTKRTGFFGNLNLKLNKSFKMTADYQYGSYEDPFTPIGPTSSHRARFTAKYKAKQYYMNGSYVYQTTDNDIGDGWKTERSQLNIRTGIANKKVKFSLGYGLIYNKLEGDRNFVFYGSPATWNILYEGRSNLVDVWLRVFASKKWALGGYANYYKNDGSWEIERLVLKPFVEIKFNGGFIGQLAYRYIDFKENLWGNESYTANIFEVSFGYKW